MGNMINRDVEAVLKSLNEEFPNPAIELSYTTQYTLVVAVILSAQATDKGVNKVTTALFSIVDTPKKMLSLGEMQLKKYIRSIGLYNLKARNIIAMSKMLVDKFGGSIPTNILDLRRLPGVGPKSANVIANALFGAPVIAVDRHVFRVSNRIGLCETSNVKETEKALLEIIPSKWLRSTHHLLVLHGRYICKARRPMCEKCLIPGLCRYRRSI